MEFSFLLPTKIEFGCGMIRKTGMLAKESGAKRVLLIADQGICSTSIYSDVKESLEREQLAVFEFHQIVANPRIKDCEAGAGFAADNQVDFLVAVGGGSSMDTGKAIAGMLGHHTTHFSVIQYPNAYTEEAYPLICIPTTAGTGSEVSTCGVVTDETTKTKVFCFDEKCHATIAICDPQVLMGLPDKIAAATALDALTHAIEGYVAKCTNAVTESFGIRAVKLIAENIRDYVYNRNLENCEAIMLGSLFAGIAFGYSDTCAVHSLSETIGGEYDTPHGIANAVFLANVTRYSIPGAMEKYAEIAQAMGIKEAGSKRALCEELVYHLRLLVNDLGIPPLKQIPGINPGDFERLAQKCSVHLSAADNPRPIGYEDFLTILKETYGE
ncbi:MAG: iron-containing alcohol dehydrogenase [Lachnospiraceae bacterium]